MLDGTKALVSLLHESVCAADGWESRCVELQERYDRLLSQRGAFLSALEWDNDLQLHVLTGATKKGLPDFLHQAAKDKSAGEEED